MWTFLIWGGILIANWLYQKYGQDPAKRPDSRLLDIAANLPRTQEGTPLPIVYGRCRVLGPTIPWYGTPISVYSDEPIPHWRYGLDMLFSVGIPMEFPPPAVDGLGFPSYELEPKLHGFYIGDKQVLNGNLPLTHGEGGVVILDAGGPGAGGQHCGVLQFYNGRPDQLISNGAGTIPDITPIATSMLKNGEQNLIPGYRGQMLVSLTAGVSYGGLVDAYEIPESGFLPSYSMEVSSYGPILFSQHGFDGFGDDANPVEVIYDLLVSDWGKAAYPSALVDLVSFAAVSATLSAEGHGYSRVHYQLEDAKTTLAKILAQLGGVLYEEPSTGKLTLGLIRNDYNPLTIPAFTQNGGGILDVEDYAVGNWRDTFNVVHLEYTSRAAGYQTRIAVAQNLANAAGQDNRKRPTTIQYPGICTEALAAAIASRELGVVSQPLAKAKITLDRRAYTLRPGQAFKATLTDYAITSGIVWRAVDIDFGQIMDGKIVVDAIQDVFSSNLAAPTQQPWSVIFLTCAPSSEHVLMEAPRLLAQQAFAAGLISDPDLGRILAIETADQVTDTYPISSIGVSTQRQLPFIVPGFPVVLEPFTPDVPQGAAPTVAKLIAPYARAAGPYDNGTTNILIGSLVGTLPPPVTDAAVEIKASGYQMILIGSELLAYESYTDNLDGTFTLTGIWRELADTVSADHAVGDRVWFVKLPDFVGRRGWDRNVRLQAMPVPRGLLLGSGGDPVTGLTGAGRARLPLRVQAFWANGKDIAGTLQVSNGVPQGGQFNDVTYLEGGVDAGGFRRDRLVATFTRGDAGDESQTEAGIGYLIKAQNAYAGSTAITLKSCNNASAVYAQALGLPLGGAGHGVINLIETTFRVVQAGEGGVGLPLPGSTLLAANSPYVRIVAPRWRNLVSNGRFDYNNLTTAWSIQQGGCTVGNDAKSLHGDATGYYFKCSGAGLAPVIKQTVPADGYYPPNMNARLVWYAFNDNDANDTATMTLDPIDGTGSSVGGTATGTAAGGLNVYVRQSLAIAAVPATAKGFNVTAQLNEVATGGTTNPDTYLTEFELILGLFGYDQLANSSFEVGGLASWTTSTGAFVTASANAKPSGVYAQGGAAASSELRQDYTLISGYTYGTMTLKLWRMQTLANDAGEVKIDVLNGGGATIASVTTGSETLPTLNTWFRRVLSVDLPNAAVTVRVRLLANRSLGSGNSGACFDDCVLNVHKHLMPVSAVEAVFSTPTIQPTPTTWQAAHLAWPTYPRANVLEGVLPSACGIELKWSDGGTTYTPVKGVGQWGGGQASINAYQFTRQSGSTALRVSASGGASSAFCSFGRAQGLLTAGFTVVVFYRVDEAALSGACGLVGRRSASLGWGLHLDASGQATATLLGDAGSKAAARVGSNTADGAWHMAAISWDPATDTLRVDDERGNSSTSTASGLGEFYTGSPLVPFELGRDGNGSGHDTIPGAIARCYQFVRPLSSAQVAAMWTYAKDPSGYVTAGYVRADTAWVPGLPDGAGATLALMASDQMALGYQAAIAATTDGYNGAGFGLAVASSVNSTNAIPTFDLTSGSWIVEAGATVTQAVVDATGSPLGAAISATSTAGFRIQNCTLGASATVIVSFYARCLTGTPTIAVDLYNSSAVLKGTATVTLSGGGLWQLYRVTFSAWDASTATGRFRFRGSAGNVQFDLTHVLMANQGGDVPSLWPRAAAGALSGNTTAQLSPSLPIQFNYEGEVLADGVATMAAPPAGAIASAANGANNKNRRELSVGASQVPRHDHYDGTPTQTTISATALDWSQFWTARGRWCQGAGLLDTSSLITRAIVAAGSVNSSNYPANTAYVTDQSVNTTLVVGTAAAAAHPVNAYVRRASFRTVSEQIAR